MLSITYANPELWGHLCFGLDNVQAGKIIHVDSYSYVTAGQHWINHEWLAEILFAMAWTAKGVPGLILLKMKVGLLTIAILYWHLRSIQLGQIRAAIFILLLGIPLIFRYFILLRPHIFTFLLFGILLLIIRQAETGKYHWLWAAIPLLVLWFYLQGGGWQA
jgi:hypothetical protein